MGDARRKHANSATRLKNAPVKDGQVVVSDPAQLPFFMWKCVGIVSVENPATGKVALSMVFRAVTSDGVEFRQRTLDGRRVPIEIHSEVFDVVQTLATSSGLALPFGPGGG